MVDRTLALDDPQSSAAPEAKSKNTTSRVSGVLCCLAFPFVPPCHVTSRKAFDKLYVCFAPADESLLVPSLERFKRLGIANVTWRPACEDKSEQDNKKLIRECSAFQICWSISAKVSSCTKIPAAAAAAAAAAARIHFFGTQDKAGSVSPLPNMFDG